MAHWAVIIPADRWATERLFHHDTLAVAAPDGSAVAGRRSPGETPAVGDDAIVVAAGAQPQAVALARVSRVAPGGAVQVTYTRRAFDSPVPAGDLALDGSLNRLDAAAYGRFAARFPGGAQRQTWLVSLDLPIEADTAAEAVRQFWSYALQLGPGELPTYVSPAGDELAMQAFVLGDQANLDPEEDDD